jgi:hypothetical protein
MPDQPKEKAAATADQLIRELRALAEKRGWVATGSGTDAEGSITVTARPKTEDE